MTWTPYRPCICRAASIRTPLKQMLAERSLYRKLLFTSEIIIYVRKTLSAR